MKDLLKKLFLSMAFMLTCMYYINAYANPLMDLKGSLAEQDIRKAFPSATVKFCREVDTGQETTMTVCYVTVGEHKFVIGKVYDEGTT